MMEFIVIPILALLFATAITIAVIRNLWAAVMFTGISVSYTHLTLPTIYSV